ncbi:MAG: GNAT family N-acetyltransferase [Gemmatimonadales bacterium]
MTDIRVHTERLEMAPLTLEQVDALLAGDGDRLRELTGVLFPRPIAPPPYMTDPLPDVRERLRRRLAEAPWWNWLISERETERAVGSVSFGGPADEAGAVLIGYAMYEQFEGHGYATEAVKAMIDWAFQQAGVKQVRTLAPVWNTPALRVAENVGMRPVASDEDDDVGEVLVYAVTARASVESA